MLYITDSATDRAVAENLPALDRATVIIINHSTYIQQLTIGILSLVHRA